VIPFPVEPSRMKHAPQRYYAPKWDTHNAEQHQCPRCPTRHVIVLSASVCAVSRSPAYGARPLIQLIQRVVHDVGAQALAAGIERQAPSWSSVGWDILILLNQKAGVELISGDPRPSSLNPNRRRTNSFHTFRWWLTRRLSPQLLPCFSS